MKISPLAGKPAPPTMLVNVSSLITANYGNVPDTSVPAQRISFGIPGHRGSAFENSFNESHVLAISQTICRYRKQQGIDGALFPGIDSHALSVPALSPQRPGDLDARAVSESHGCTTARCTTNLAASRELAAGIGEQSGSETACSTLHVACAGHRPDASPAGSLY